MCRTRYISTPLLLSLSAPVVRQRTLRPVPHGPSQGQPTHFNVRKIGSRMQAIPGLPSPGSPAVMSTLPPHPLPLSRPVRSIAHPG
jgi:hypothetical protein